MGWNSEKFSNSRKVERSEKYKKIYSGRVQDNPFVSPSQMEDDTKFWIRFLPKYPERCPDGWRKISTHEIEVQPGQIIKTFCLLETDNLPCCVCDSMEALVDEILSFSEEKQKVIKRMSSYTRYLIPIALRATPRNELQEDGRTFATWVPNDDVEIGAIWQVSAGGLIGDIDEMMTENPEFNDEDRGRYLRFSRKGNKYTLIPAANPSKLKNMALITEKQYPRLMSMYKKTVKNYTYEEQQRLLSTCWWAKGILEFEDGPDDVDMEEPLPFD